MTRIVRSRRITLHFSHIGLTLGRTFIGASCQSGCWSCRWSWVSAGPAPTREVGRSPCLGPGASGGAAERGLLVAVGDSAAGEIVGGELDLDLVTGEDADVVAPHLARYMAQHVVTVLEFDPEHRIGERFCDGAFEHDRIFFVLWQNMPFRLVSALETGNSGTAREQPPAGSARGHVPAPESGQGCRDRPAFYASGVRGSNQRTTRARRCGFRGRRRFSPLPGRSLTLAGSGWSDIGVADLHKTATERPRPVDRPPPTVGTR